MVNLNIDMPKISVIICAYNSAAFIKKAVESCLGQTLSDIEVILVNDGSADNTLELCEEFSRIDPRVKVIDIENGGPANARNVGMLEATGEYIAFCDADDYIELDAFEVMYDAALSNDSDMVICGLYHELYKNERSVSIHRVFVDAAVYETQDELLKDFIQLKSGFILDSSCNKIFKRSVIIENSLTMPIGELFEDTSFVLSFLNKSCKVSVLDRCFYHYILREKGSITRSYDKRKLTDLNRLYSELKSFTDKADDNVKSFCDMFYIRTVFSCLCELYGKGVTSRKEKISVVKSAVQSQVFKTAVKTAKSNGFSDKVTLIVARSKCVWLCRLYSHVLWFMKNKARRLFAKLK